MALIDEIVVNTDEVEDTVYETGQWGCPFKVLTPSMRERGGTLGVSQNRLRPGNTTCPFHFHMREDEIFIIQSGRGVLRYGDELKVLRPGDTVSCPAGTKIAHQIANPFDEVLVYLCIGPHDPHEVCGYPDSGKTFVRGLGTVGFLNATPYMEGEPDKPTVFDLIEQARAAGTLD